MNAVFSALHQVTSILVSPVDWLGPFWGLTLISLISTVGILWVVRATTPQARVERARARMAASIYEIRLFLDSPRRVFASQGRLLGSSFAYVGFMLPALVILSLPLWLAYLQIEARLGLDPVPLGEPTVVRVELADDVDGRAVSAPPEQDGLRITAPPLHDGDTNRVYLRLVADEPGDLTLALDVAGTRVDKRVVTDPAASSVSPERQSGFALLDSVTTEPALDPDTGVRAIVVPHPPKDQRWLGVAMPWWVYSLGLILVAAVVLARRLGIKL